MKSPPLLNRIPTATYRIRFQPGRTLAEVREMVPYLEALGISDLCLPPLLKPRRGSLPGFPAPGPQEIDPDLGGRRAFEVLTRTLRSAGLGLIADVVPNHQALHPENPWWWSVLESGPASPQAVFFDIDWHPLRGMPEGKVLLPILNAAYGKVLERGEISLHRDQGGFFIRYEAHRFPLEPRSWLQILTHHLSFLEKKIGEDHPAVLGLGGLIARIKELPPYPSCPRSRQRSRQQKIEGIKKGLWNLAQGYPEIREFLEENRRRFNGLPGEAQSFDLLDTLLEEQPYRLACWQVGRERINYRRFSSLNGLIGLRVEEPEVFEALHAGLWPFIAEEKITGLRIDHLVGLYDPQGYLEHLQWRIRQEKRKQDESEEFFILADIPLWGDEKFPTTWPAAGTSGFDFLGKLNGLLVHPEGFAKLKSTFRRFTGERRDFQEIVARKKKQVLHSRFGGELESLTDLLVRLADEDRQARDVSRQSLRRIIEEALTHFPGYRSYLRDFQISISDKYLLIELLKRIRRLPDLDPEGLDFLERIFGLNHLGGPEAAPRSAGLSFLMRWQQFTGAITTLGREHTARYVPQPLIALNEIGGRAQAERLDDFHRFNRERQVSCPFTLNATSAPDTQRGEDVRARLQVLSEIPEDWEHRFQRWAVWNASVKTKLRDRPVPGPGEELFIYQTLLGFWPLQPEEIPACRNRLDTYLVRAAREASVGSEGLVDPDYDRALQSFLNAIWDERRESPFLADFLQFQNRLAFWGALNALSQILLKTTSPGIPDFYQGTELWDLRLVDLDNPDPVDFRLRRTALRRLDNRAARGERELAARLLQHWKDGLIKLLVTAGVLRFRRSQAKLFQSGAYLPLAVQGVHKDRVVAFARALGDTWSITVAGRFFAGISEPGRFPVGEACWGGTALVLPRGGPGRWKNVLTGEEWEPQGVTVKKVLPLASVFRQMPQALLTGVPKKPVRRRSQEKMDFEDWPVWAETTAEEEEAE